MEGVSRSAVKLFAEFHSRDPRKLWTARWNPPKTLYAVGGGIVLYYSSDKKDPGDPKDPGGIWKGYYHEQEPDTLVYVPQRMAREILRHEKPLAVISPRWPDTLVWLGSADGFDAEVCGRKETIELDGGSKMRGLQLWGFPDRRCLVTAPADGGRENECILWCGPQLTIGHDGVEG